MLAFGLALAAAALYLVAAQLAFDSGLILSVVYPLLALALAAVGTLALHYLRAAFERQRVRFTFSRFVPEEVVDEVLAHGEDQLQLGGVRRESTVLFSDLRGFTSYAETRAPEEVVEILNRYLSEMTDAIMDHGGTLVAYMGDGIMAVFGAPIEQPDHADRAIAAAREMLEVRLPAFCEWMRGAGHGDGFTMGIGLNSGEVMSGQVGSERRMEYTTIGDTTNTASRLEGMTKGSGHQIFIADSTRAARAGAFRSWSRSASSRYGGASGRFRSGRCGAGRWDRRIVDTFPGRVLVGSSPSSSSPTSSGTSCCRPIGRHHFVATASPGAACSRIRPPTRWPSRPPAVDEHRRLGDRHQGADRAAAHGPGRSRRLLDAYAGLKQVGEEAPGGLRLAVDQTGHILVLFLVALLATS